MKDQRENSEITAVGWNPLLLDGVLGHGLFKNRTILLLAIWIALIFLSIYSVLMMIPESWVAANLDGPTIQQFFLFYPPLLIGSLLLFWLGFEWGFIPVFLSSFVIAFSASMGIQWALLFAFSFVLGLGIYALAYHCVPAKIDLRSLKSISFFIIVSVVAAMASSLGSFVWSLSQQMSPAQTLNLWKGWWTGSFFQSLLILGPLLFIFTPSVNRLRNKWFDAVVKPPVTLQWIYGAISSVVIVTSLFVVGGKILGTEGIERALELGGEQLAARVIQATDSFQLIFWISIGIILVVGFTGIYLVSSWNQTLQMEVDEKTSTLRKRERELEETLKGRDRLLNEIHGRVKNNLSLILALFELQLKRTGDDSLTELLKDSKSRVRAISLIHELMSQTGTFEALNLNSYIIKLSNRLEQDYRFTKVKTEININAEDLILDVERAVPVCMILNEVISRVYEKVNLFPDIKTGNVSIDLFSDSMSFYLVVRESGYLPAKFFDWTQTEDLGVRLIRLLSKQIKGEVIEDDSKNSIAIVFPHKEISELEALEADSEKKSEV